MHNSPVNQIFLLWFFYFLITALIAGCSETGMVHPAGTALSTRGIPPVPDSLRQQLQRELDWRFASLVDWTDSGLVVLRKFDETTQLYRICKPGDSLIPLTCLNESVVQAWVCPARPRTTLLFISDSGGNEQFRIHSLDIHSGQKQPVTSDSAQNDGISWSNRGDRFAYSSNRRNGVDFDVFLCPADSPGSYRSLITAGGMWSAGDWAPDDRSLLVGHYTSRTISQLYICNVTTGALTPLTDTTDTVSQELGTWGPGGTGVFYTSDYQTDFRSLHYIDLSTHNDTLLTADIPWDVRELSLSSDRSTLAFSTNEHGFSGIYLMNTITFEFHKLSGLPPGIIGTLRFNPSGGSLAISITTPGTPDDVYEYTLSTGSLTRWTKHSRHTHLEQPSPIPKVITYPAFDSANGAPRQIPGLIYKPATANTSPTPVLIIIHGGPETQFWPSYKPEIVFYVNTLGLTVIAPNVRGSGGYGKRYLSMDDGTKREDAVRDIGALLDWIALQPDLDSSRLAVMGGSYGGYMALSSMVHYNNRLRAGIDSYGISNFVTFLENTSGYRQNLRRVEYGDERDPAMWKFLTAISPLTHVNNITKPLLIVQGANDARVPLSESQQIETALRKKGAPVWFLVAGDEGHGFRKKSNREFQEVVTVMFLKRFLLGE